MGPDGAIAIPGGLWAEGARHREVELRPPAGPDVAGLLDDLEGLPQARWTTALLARCLGRLGASGEASPEAVRALSAGDREALLLHLLRHWAGDRVECVVECPRCGERLDVEIAASELLLEPYEHESERHEATVEDGGESWTASFRLPNGADQEAAISLDEVAGARLILERCLDGVWRDGDRVETIPEAVAKVLPATMESLDPQAELMLSMDCESCGERFRAALDAAVLLAHALAERRAELEWEVHVLALHYHWSEAEILKMGPRRRQRCLELLGEAAGAGAPA